MGQASVSGLRVLLGKDAIVPCLRGASRLGRACQTNREAGGDLHRQKAFLTHPPQRDAELPLLETALLLCPEVSPAVVCGIQLPLLSTLKPLAPLSPHTGTHCFLWLK